MKSGMRSIGQVADEHEQKQLASSGDARIMREAGDEDDAVGDEGSERPSIAAPTGEDERAHGHRIDDQQHGHADQEPGPPRHERKLRD
jgi:hypothetical protein